MIEMREVKDLLQVILPLCRKGVGFAESVELGKFDPPLWHAPYGRIV